MRIGILTGGGDVPGLNAAIKTVTVKGEASGHKVLGIRRGWMGLLHLNPDDPASLLEFTQELNRASTRTVDRTGGTFLHTSRVNPQSVAKEKVPGFIPEAFREARADGKIDCTRWIIYVLGKLGVDILIPIGGEDTLSYGARLYREGFPVVAIPKTMDNDVYGTDFCIGFSTAVTRSVYFIHQLRSCTGSHERIGVIELFGRHSGETSLISAYLAGVDRAVISEVPFDTARLADLLMRDKRENPSNYSMLTLSEGASPLGGRRIECGEEDAYGHKKLGGIANWTAGELEKLTGEKTMVQNLAYLMRSGAPDALDLMVAVNFANCALDLIAEKKFGRMVALKEGRYIHVDADSCVKGEKTVDVDTLYDRAEYKPKLSHGLGMPMFLY